MSEHNASFSKEAIHEPNRSIVHCSRIHIFNNRYQRHFCEPHVKTQRYQLPAKKKRDKSGTVRLRLPLFPARRRWCTVTWFIFVMVCRDVHVRAVRSSTGPRASTCVSPLFLICASNHAASHSPRHTRASMLYWQISILKSAEQWRLFSVFNGHCAGRGQQLSVFCPPPSRASHIFLRPSSQACSSNAF